MTDGEFAANSGQQLELMRAGPSTTSRRKRRTPAAELASELPIARVAVNVTPPHLDRLFDYLVPAALAQTAQAGVRVRVPFGHQAVAGYVVERVAASEFSGTLARLTRVVSPEPVLDAELCELARTVADRYAGTLADVLQLAIPPRHARVETEPAGQPLPPPASPHAGPWQRYPAGAGYLAALAGGGSPRAVWNALPGAEWPATIARAAHATLASGRGVLVVAPTGRDVARLDAAFSAALGEGRHVALTAELGPAERYRRWLAVRRGIIRAVVGARAAMFAPVAQLGLTVIWDDGDASHAELRAPFPHAREVLGLRAHQTNAAALIGGFGRTTEAEQLIATGWARPLTAKRSVIRDCAPRIRATADDTELARDPAARGARLPTVAWQAARDGLRHGPVLVQVPRRGYLPGLACERCRAPARCATCAGPLAVASNSVAAHCRWCDRPAQRWRCPECAASGFRARSVGAQRTAEELGRAFPGIPIRLSGRDAVVLTSVPAQPALIVATPGAEPVADGGYAAALLLDGWALLTRPNLRVAEEALRCWLSAAALVRSAPAGGTVVVVADASLAPVQALLRWDSAGFAGRELAERTSLGFPPAVRMAALSGSFDAVREVISSLSLPPQAEILGTVLLSEEPEEQQHRALIRAPRPAGAALATALKAGLADRALHRSSEPVRVQIDPLDLG